jgi:ABC-type sulfate transport system substrate-binding protein
MFITWYSGVDIFDRGGEQAFMFFVGVVIGVVIQFFQSEKQ